MDLKDLASDILERCRRAGATDAEVALSDGRQSELEVRDGAVDRLVAGQPRSVSIRVWQGDRSAAGTATDLGAGAVDRLIRDAMDLIPLTDPVPEQALPEAAWLATELPDLDLHDPRIEALGPDERIELIRRAEAAAMAADARVSISGGAGWSDASSTQVLANSRGFLGAVTGGWASLYVEVIANDTDHRKRNGAWSSVARFLEDLEEPEQVGERAARRAVGMLGAGPIPTERLPVVFDPHAGASLLGSLFQVISGSAVERGASFLSDAVGTVIASPLVTVVDDPHRRRGLGSRPFDGEGLPTRETVFVERGTLKQLALSCYHARRLHLTPTGHATGSGGEKPSNLYLAPGTTPREELIAGVRRGFYCESMMGFGFNPSTGDYSRGASGYLIEDGQLTRPVSEVTLSSTLGEILSGIDAVGDELIFDRSVVAPSFRVASMTLAGT